MKLKAITKNKLDKIWADKIKARDKYCQKCGAGSAYAQMQAAHVRSRRYLSTRWMLENGVCLCAGCHWDAHLNPVEFGIWFISKFPDRWESIKLQKNKVVKSTQVYLQEQFEALKNET